MLAKHMARVIAAAALAASEPLAHSASTHQRISPPMAKQAPSPRMMTVSPNTAAQLAAMARSDATFMTLLAITTAWKGFKELCYALNYAIWINGPRAARRLPRDIEKTCPDFLCVSRKMTRAMNVPTTCL